MNSSFLNISFTTLIVIITIIISGLAWSNKAVLNRLIFHPPSVNRGQWYRFITHGFIHADLTHLLFNMFTLYFFGRAVEPFFNQYLNGYGFIVIYLLAIVVAMIPSYLSNKNNNRYFSLGASGGVSAVLFAYILMAPWEPLYLYAAIPIPAIVFAIAYVAYSVYANNKGGSNINHMAHLWGGAFGIIATIALNPPIVGEFLYALMRPSF